MGALTRRAALAGLCAPALLARLHGAKAQQARVLKISHQFPASDGETGDFRDRLVRRFAREVEARTKGALKFEILPNATLVKTFAQFNALKRGAIDLSIYPINYSGTEIPELNLTFMPALVTSYDQAYRWKDAEIGRELTRLVEAKGVKILTWVWQAGGIASRSRAINRPPDAAGLKIRGGSREMDTMFKAAGATTAIMPSNEIYPAMQTGAIDAAATSSTSLLSFRLEELTKHLTASKQRSLFFICEPILMSAQTFNSLSPEQQAIVTEVGSAMEPLGREWSMADDQALAERYRKADVVVHDFDEANLAEWKKVAASSAWKDYAARSAEAARLLQLALQV